MEHSQETQCIVVDAARWAGSVHGRHRGCLAHSQGQYIPYLSLFRVFCDCGCTTRCEDVVCLPKRRASFPMGSTAACAMVASWNTTCVCATRRLCTLI